MEQTSVLERMPRNMWRTRNRMNFPLDSLALYLPLWHPELSGSSFLSKDLNAYSCTVIGATWGIQGRTFDGDDYISQATFLDVAPAKVTFEVWFNLTSNFGAGSPLRHFLFFKTNITGEDRIWFYLNQVDGKLTLTAEYNDGGLSSFASDIASWVGGTWYHAAITFDGATWLMYVDGVLQAGSIAKAGFMKDGTQSDFLIGSDLTNYFVGIMGEWRAYNRDLTLAEIQHNRNATKWRY